MRRFDAAQHEAAHLVVGAALGLRPRRAVLSDTPLRGLWYEQGGCWFDGRSGTTEAWCLMLAAGVAWERATTGHVRGARGDLAVLKSFYVHTRQRIHTYSTAAGAMLAELGAAHGRLTRALLDHDLTSDEIMKLTSARYIAQPNDRHRDDEAD